MPVYRDCRLTAEMAELRASSFHLPAPTPTETVALRPATLLGSLDPAQRRALCSWTASECGRCPEAR